MEEEDDDRQEQPTLSANKHQQADEEALTLELTEGDIGFYDFEPMEDMGYLDDGDVIGNDQGGKHTCSPYQTSSQYIYSEESEPLDMAYATGGTLSPEPAVPPPFDNDALLDRDVDGAQNAADAGALGEQEVDEVSQDQPADSEPEEELKKVYLGNALGIYRLRLEGI